MSKLIKDIKTAVNLFLDMRKARGDGKEIAIEKKTQLPLIQSGGFYNTVEGCMFSRYKEICNIANAVFDSFPDEVKYQLQWSPKRGEFAERADLWRAALKPVMTDKQYNISVNAILNLYGHIGEIQEGNTAA